MKKYILRVVIILFLLILGYLNIDKKEIKLENGEKIIETFQNRDLWQIYDYNLDYYGEPKSIITISGEGYDDNSSIFISCDTLNDVRIYKKLKLEPNSYYKISVMIKGETGTDGKGISISAMNCFESYDIKDTLGDWKEYVIFVKTLSNQNELSFSLGLGGYSAVSKGYAYFDNFTIEKINEVPDGEKIITFDKNAYSINSVSDNNELMLKFKFLFVVIFILIISMIIMKKTI